MVPSAALRRNLTRTCACRPTFCKVRGDTLVIARPGSMAKWGEALANILPSVAPPVGRSDLLVDKLLAVPLRLENPMFLGQAHPFL